MARYVEFQGKNSTTGEWITGNLLFASSAFNHYELLSHEHTYIEQHTKTGMLVKHMVIPETIGQYTNVIGCNGEKIYDHDIITDGIVEGEVYWDYCYKGWRIAVTNDKSDVYGLDFDNTFKVVGHKYDRLVHGKQSVV